MLTAYLELETVCCIISGRPHDLMKKIALFLFVRSKVKAGLRGGQMEHQIASFPRLCLSPVVFVRCLVRACLPFMVF